MSYPCSTRFKPNPSASADENQQYSVPYIFESQLSETLHLRREVGNRAAVGTHRRPGAVKIAQAEVGEFDLLQAAGAREQDVVQLHVAVADVLVVSVAHAADDLIKHRIAQGSQRR